jgi:hypothetical protein
METILWAYDLVFASQALSLPKEVQQWNIATLAENFGGSGQHA